MLLFSPPSWTARYLNRDTAVWSEFSRIENVVPMISWTLLALGARCDLAGELRSSRFHVGPGNVDARRFNTSVLLISSRINITNGVVWVHG